jgi:prepilin-type N-terminal cleavage/methylation domain-containing protein
MMPKKNSKSFTLIELLIVLALISIIATVLILTINPGGIFSRARDTKRINDLKNIEKIMDTLYSTEQTFNELNYASPNVVYISLKDSSSTCGSYLSELPSLPSGWSYRCSATPTNIDGTGWIPIPFSNFPILNISQLFIDPINKPPYYYSFVVGGSYEVEAKLESNFQASLNDGGDSGGFYEKGTNLTLTPPEARSGSRLTKDDVDKILKISCPTCSQGLVGYWSFDEGSGTIAKDYSGNGNDGTIYGGATWTTGKVGGALSFDGVNDFVNVPDATMLRIPGDITIVFWMKKNLEATDWQRIVGKGNSTYRNYGVWEEAGTGKKILFQQYGGGCNFFSNGTVELSQWYFIASVRQNSTAGKIFINDQIAQASCSSGSTYTSSDPLTIGYAGFHTYFPGLIDEVRIYNRALSDSEIKALYYATK